jgi:hypothetical protein
LGKSWNRFKPKIFHFLGGFAVSVRLGEGTNQKNFLFLKRQGSGGKLEPSVQKVGGQAGGVDSDYGKNAFRQISSHRNHQNVYSDFNIC